MSQISTLFDICVSLTSVVIPNKFLFVTVFSQFQIQTVEEVNWEVFVSEIEPNGLWQRLVVVTL